MTNADTKAMLVCQTIHDKLLSSLDEALDQAKPHHSVHEAEIYHKFFTSQVLAALFQAYKLGEKEANDYWNP